MDTMQENQESANINLGTLFRDWIALLIRPGGFFPRVIAGDVTRWAFPMILLTLVVILQSIGQALAADPPQGGLTLFIGIIFNLVTIWLAWLWMSSVLRAFLVLAGIRSPEAQPRILIAWAMSPLVFRYLARLVYTLITGAAVNAPGLSGFLSTPTGLMSIFISQLLAQFDLYLVWQTVLLWVGLKHFPAIRPAQRVLALLITVLSLLTLYALLRIAGVYLQIP